MYDSKEGIGDSLTCLHALNELIAERHTAGYDRQERMTEFVILGRYYLDTCGNIWKSSVEFVPKDEFPDIPDVLTMDEFDAYLKAQAPERDFRSSWGIGSDIPDASLSCPCCGERWTVDNCHDTVVYSDTEVIDLSEFAGKTLGEVKAHFGERTDAAFRLLNYTDRPIRSAGSSDDWRGIREGVDDDYVVCAGDEGHFYRWQYYHRQCNRSRLNQKAEEKFRELFTSAGFTNFKMEQIPNGYMEWEKAWPWFRVTLSDGEVVTIGWRKRVINIDFSGTSYSGDLTGGDDVTKSAEYCHAWDYEKAEEYLTRLREGLKEKAALGA